MLHSINDLVEDLRAYTEEVSIDVEQVRAALLAERKRKRILPIDLAKKSKVAASMISRMEDLETSYDHVQLITIIKMVYGLGLTLTEFFARVEGLRGQPASDKTTVPLETPTNSDAAAAPVSSSADAASARLSTFIYDLIDALHAVVETNDRSPDHSGQQDAAPRHDQPTQTTRPRRSR